MTNHTNDISPRQAALVAGVAYLFVFIFTPHAWINKLIVPEDAVITFQNITSDELLFRLGIACWLIVLVADTVVAWALLRFLHPINKGLSLLAAMFRLLFVAVMTVSVMNWLNVLYIIESADHSSAYNIGELQAQVMQFLTAYGYASNIAHVFFGLHIGLLGYLALKSDSIPLIFGILLVVAFVGYQIDSFASFLSTRYTQNPLGFVLTVAIPAIIAEFSFTLWLLLKGGRPQPA